MNVEKIKRETRQETANYIADMALRLAKVADETPVLTASKALRDLAELLQSGVVNTRMQ